MDEIHALCLGSNWRAESREQIAKSMTSSFKEKYPNLGYIIDCVEFQNETPSLLVLHEIVFSHYKTDTNVILKKAEGGQFDSPAFSRARVKPCFFWSFFYIFPENFIKIPQIIQKIWRFFSIFLTFPCSKETNDIGT